MTKYKAQGIHNTFRNARKGVRLVLKSEMNIRVHMIFAVFVILLAMLFNLSTTKICILLLTISSVISAEMFNSALEFALDAVFHNRYSKMVGMAKDISAGAVMFVTFVAVVIGCFVFIPSLISYFAKF